MSNFPKLPRRAFFRISGAAALGALYGCGDSAVTVDVPIQVDADLLRAHRLFQPQGAPRVDSQVLKRDLLVVGGGIAGLAAAYALRDRDLVVCDIGRQLGGSSASGSYKNLSYAQGAHYDLAYPNNYGKEVLGILEELGIVAFDPMKSLWAFTDTQYNIDPEGESRCWADGRYREDPLPPNDHSKRFTAMLRTYRNQMPMPTRLIAPEFRFLNQISFKRFLDNLKLTDSPEFMQGLNYQMVDDYGATTETVSALAGIHYYCCRPYYTQTLKHFSPPQGNAYFVDKLAEKLPFDQLWPSHLIHRIEESGGGFKVKLLDLEANLIKTLLVDRVVYAGQKKGLQYTFPKDAPLFEHVTYAPWLAVNLVLGKKTGTGFWQNEAVGLDPRFAGLVNSQAQVGPKNQTILTAYFCLPRENRQALVDIASDPKPWVRHTVGLINRCLGESIDSHLVHVAVKLHGHAMPIARPGYLFRDANPQRSNPRLVYAGVDNGYLPLFFEAMDSGLMAAAELEKS